MSFWDIPDGCCHHCKQPINGYPKYLEYGHLPDIDILTEPSLTPVQRKWHGPYHNACLEKYLG